MGLLFDQILPSRVQLLSDPRRLRVFTTLRIGGSSSCAPTLALRACSL